MTLLTSFLDQTKPVAEHGGPDLEELRRLGVDPTTLLDFSVNINPFGPSPRVYDALAHVALEQYPDREAHALRSAVAERFGISPDRILAGNGVSELIWLTALAFVKPQTRVLVIGPTYGEYARSVSLLGGVVAPWNARQDDHFAVPNQEIEDELNHCRPSLVFVCNPNNPTGTILAPNAIASWARRNPRTLFVVDESYQAFAPALESMIPAREHNLLILRSMTKDYALAGLRIGFAVGSKEVIGHLARVRPPWSVNSMAQAGALAALQDDDYLALSLEKLAAEKKSLINGLSELGLAPLASATHFFLLQVKDGAAFRLALLRKKILVRDAASFGLPGYVRLATRTPADNAQLLAVLSEARHDG